MNNLDSQLIFEAYYNARKRTLNEGLIDAIKNKFKDFTADVIKPYAVKAMQFIAKKDPALAKQIAQAIKSKNLESLKNILKPGLDELSQGAKVNTEDLQTIRNFLNTGFGKGIAGAILALAAFTVVTGGIGSELNADGTIDTVTVDDGDASTTTLAEFEQILKDAGINPLTATDDEIKGAELTVRAKELEAKMKDHLKNKMLRLKLKEVDPVAYNTLIKIKGNMSIGNEPMQNMSQDQIEATKRLLDYNKDVFSKMDLMKNLNKVKNLNN